MDNTYKKLLKEIISNNNSSLPSGREGMPNTKSSFALHAKYKVEETDFNICTAKKVDFKNITTELLWFMKGFTNVSWLNRRGNYIWNEDAYNYYEKLMRRHGNRETKHTILTFKEFDNLLKVGADHTDPRMETLKKQCADIRYHGVEYDLGDCGKQYGWLWRNNDNVDQLVNLITSLKQNPFSRRHILSAWNVRTLHEMALPACHSFAQFKVEQNKAGQFWLNTHLTQRSGDMFLGVPYNVSSYSLLTIMLARVLGYNTGEFSHIIVDAHIYEDHLDAVEEYLDSPNERYPVLEFSQKYLEYEKKVKDALNNDVDVKLLLTTINNWINSIDYNDIQLKGYLGNKVIKAKLHTGKKS